MPCYSIAGLPVNYDAAYPTLQKHSENTCKSRYVWLPIEWQGEKPVIRWKNEWRVEDYR